ncbi:MAG: superoxide dismutase [Ni] [Planctomycetota bacterium]
MIALTTALGPLLLPPVPLPTVTPTAPVVAPAPVHCQVPCGIYGDHMRVEMIREDAATIRKAMAQIAELGTADVTNFNQVVRWVTTKEEHAQRIQDQLSQYWLAQRIKKPADQEGMQTYVGQLACVHEMTVSAMKCKQTTDAKHVDNLLGTLERLRGLYFSAEDLKTIRQHALDSTAAPKKR